MFDPDNAKTQDFSFPGGRAQLSVRESETGRILAIRLPYKGAYGMGERFDGLNQKGRRVINRVEEHFCTQGDKAYCPAPFFFTDSGFGLYVDTLRVTVFEFEEEIVVRVLDKANFDDPNDPASAQAAVPQAASYSGKTAMVLFAGTPAEIISEYMSFIGTPVLPPKWVFGPWISANRWKTQAQVEERLGDLKKYRFPATVVVIEAWSDEATFYIFNGAHYRPVKGGEVLNYDDFTFPADGPWPNPRGMINTIHDDGLRLVLWQIPVYKKQEDSDPVTVQRDADNDYAVQQKLCVREKGGTPYAIPPGHWFAGSLLPDFTNPETRRLWFAKRRYLLDIGVDGFKTDGGEFIYSDDVVFHNGAGGAEMKNGYAQTYTTAYQNFLGKHGDTDKVLFSRAGYSGQHTTPILWAGDQQSTFEELQSQLRAGLSAALSGIIFWGFDIGGFAGPLPRPELYLRATELACFCPVMQWHSEPEGGQFSDLLKSSGGNNERSPWNIAEGIDGTAFLEHIRFYHNLRMNLLPYLYSEARCCVRDRKPLMRPLIYDWPLSEAAGKASESGQFMLGRAILAAPVLEPGKDSRSLWLPEGEWYGFFDNRFYAGGAWIDAPCEDGIPVFVKSGSAIPLNCLAGNSGDEGGALGSPVGNRINGYRNLYFRLYGNSGQTHFEDDLGNDFDLQWEAAGNPAQKGRAVSPYTSGVICKGSAAIF